ncbi:ChaN family lipoprotein [Portibacter marinus]|uniref:ChaN family lipoprotein n=1 Tax=Portibacter marinus TaxID=2898660 RepID=UPI001F306464|nr:ChaN family lipoprotein [Portibacter marinus]
MFKFKNVSLIFVLVLITLQFPALAQKAQSHQLLNDKLKKSSFKKLIKSAQKADVIFFGEMHDDPISHWLQLKLIKALDEKNNLILGLEMFERDNQSELDQYLNDEIDLATFEKEARLWNNYKTDYAPLINYAREKGINVVATNIPRRYASMVYKQGFGAIESLVAEEKAYIAPLPIEFDIDLPGYQKMLNMVEGHGGENFPKAQAIKDATMAHSISENIKEGKIFFHANGRYHSDHKEGIIWYLRKYRPDLKILTITTIMEGEVPEKGVADYIIMVDEDMIKTY